MLKRVKSWMFSVQDSPLPYRVVIWWELRRIPFNLLIGLYGFICLLVYALAISASGHLGPGEDAVEPMALMAAPVIINVLYTLGWLLEVPLRLLCPTLNPCFGPMLLRVGVGLGMVLISIPAVFWVVFLLLQQPPGVR